MDGLVWLTPKDPPELKYVVVDQETGVERPMTDDEIAVLKARHKEIAEKLFPGLKVSIESVRKIEERKP